MGRSNFHSLRSLPRAFVDGLPDPLIGEFELPREESHKFRKVLRLTDGDEVAILPGDGRLVRCGLRDDSCVPLETHHPTTESYLRLTVALGLPRQESLEQSLRMATEIGAAAFVVFPTDRSVVRWDKATVAKKFERLSKIIRESAEVSYRTVLPSIQWRESLGDVLKEWPDSVVLSEQENAPCTVHTPHEGIQTIVIGAEGGWSPREVELIGDRALSLGPRVLRVDTAVASACARFLLS